MSNTSLLILSICFSLLFGNILSAQEVQIKGTIVEAISQQAIEFATIMVNDNTTKQTIAGITSDQDGNFEIKYANKNYLKYRE